MNRNESEYVSDHQVGVGVDNYHDYIVEQLNRYMQQHSHDNMYEQGIHTIRPPERSGYNTPARQAASTSKKHQPPVKTTTNVPTPPVFHPAVHRPYVTSPPHLTPPVVGQFIRPSFAVDLVIGFKEISVDLRKCVKDVVKQNYNVVSKLGQFVSFVMFIGLAALYLNRESDTTSPLIMKPFIHPPNLTHVFLPDGRHLAYQDQGVSAEKARFSIIAPHAFFSSRLAGIPGIKISLLQEFGVRLITYDLPGFGKSDPHPNRNLK